MIRFKDLFLGLFFAYRLNKTTKLGTIEVGGDFMNSESKRFNYFEKLIFRIYLGIVGMAFVLMSLLFTSIETLQAASDLISAFFAAAMMTLIVGFVTSIIRIFKYFRNYRDDEDVIGVKRSVSILLSSPIVLAVYMFMLLMLGLSMASCS